jgi:CRISP-associated protein Cas1
MSQPLVNIDLAPVSRPAMPDYLPARMINEFVYCKRLFHLEWVEGLFVDSVDTIEGRLQHRNVDKPSAPMPMADQAEGVELKSRSLTLSSEKYKVIARLDLAELKDGAVCPVDYKHGSPQIDCNEQLQMWPADRMQVMIQALLLREAGYECNEAFIFYQGTRQRVRLAINAAIIREAEICIEAAWMAAKQDYLPPPLENSPKCDGCSMVGICLPDETRQLRANPPEMQLALFPDEGTPRKPPEGGVRRLLAARDDLRPIYCNTQGVTIGKSGDVLVAKEKGKVIQEIRLRETCQLNLFGNVQLTTQAIQTLCEAGIPIGYFSMSGWFYGFTNGMLTKNVFLRRSQYRLADSEWFALKLSRELIAGKIKNQRVLLQRNHVEPQTVWLDQMKVMAKRATEARSIPELLGIEGTAARIYFGAFAGMLKLDDDEKKAGEFTFDFNGRNRRPPRDPVNALLSLAYSVLAKDNMVACYGVGFDPLIGFLHQPRFGRPALALDLMEPFRPLIADSAVLSAINTGMVQPKHFVRNANAASLTPEGRKGFFRAYEQRMDQLVTHPLFNYRLTYRRILEVQARILARVLEGETENYTAFVTR